MIVFKRRLASSGIECVSASRNLMKADCFFMAICHRGSPQVLADLSNNEKARRVRRPGREFDMAGAVGPGSRSAFAQRASP
jgi:hypothetical protein